MNVHEKIYVRQCQLAHYWFWFKCTYFKAIYADLSNDSRQGSRSSMGLHTFTSRNTKMLEMLRIRSSCMTELENGIGRFLQMSQPHLTVVSAGYVKIDLCDLESISFANSQFLPAQCGRLILVRNTQLAFEHVDLIIRIYLVYNEFINLESIKLASWGCLVFGSCQSIIIIFNDFINVYR